MAFSSISFLFYFLPLFFIIYYLIPARAKNVVLLAGSLFFYAWGEPRWILLLLASILVTWLLGRAMRPEASAGRRRGLLILGLVFQLGLLVAVKYAGFFFGAFIDLPKLHLPLGVSFYTFHAISYLVDVYRQKTPPQKNLLRLGLYLALFPKLVMGPIVPYHELEPALAQRTIAAQDVSDGCLRFTIGLAKKALLADALAGLVTGIWGDLASLTVLSAWLGLIGYALQLYFDFSGYSDMAIGLGRMLGFRFPQNFRYPYLCSSISDFWRRWHISLGSWFKEYLYFPLGGSRAGTLRTLRNLLLVWLATGLWHGASWNYVLWGLYFGVLICLEKLLAPRFRAHPRKGLLAGLYQPVCLLLAVLGWVLFRAEDLPAAGRYFACLFGGAAGASAQARLYLHDFWPVLLLGAEARRAARREAAAGRPRGGAGRSGAGAADVQHGLAAERQLPELRLFSVLGGMRHENKDQTFAAACHRLLFRLLPVLPRLGACAAGPAVQRGGKPVFGPAPGNAARRDGLRRLRKGF